MTNKKAGPLYWTISVTALMSCSPAWADQAPPPATGDAGKVGQTGDIIVTAQRRSESLSRTPVAVSVLTSEALVEKAVQTDSDLQIAVPGLIVRATEDSNQLNFVIRGQTVDAFSSSQPAVQGYVDEVPVTGASGSAFYDLDSIQVLKGPQGTLFGKNVTGGAVLFTTVKPRADFGGYVTGQIGDYGRRAIQGALNVPIIAGKVLLRVAGDIERRDGFTHDFLSGARYGDVRREAVRGTLTIKPFDGFANTTVVEYFHSGGTATPSVIYNAYAPGSTNNGITLTATTAVLFGPLLDTVAGPGAYAAYVAAHPGTDPKGLLSYVAAQDARGPYSVAFNRMPASDARSTFVSNITTYDLASNLQFKNIFGYYRNKSRVVLDSDGTPYGILNMGPLGNQKIFRDITEEAQILGKAFNNKLNFVVGGYYDNQKSFDLVDEDFFDLSPIIPVTTAEYISDLRFKTYAAYAQGTYDLSSLTGLSGLGFTAGVRYTDVKVTFNPLPGSVLYNIPGLPNEVSTKANKVSWQFGLQEQANQNLLIYAVTRRSFRPGGFNIYAAQVPGTAEAGGNRFLPETATDVEGGIKFLGRFGEMPGRANLAVYKQWTDQIQRSVYAVIQGQVSSLTANIPQAQVSGVEFDGSINPAQWLELGGSVAYTNARFSQNTAALFGTVLHYGPYPDTPKWSGSAYAQVTVPLSKAVGILTARGDIFAQKMVYFSSLNNTLTPGTNFPGYALVNFRVGLDKVAGSRFSIAAYVKNAFDRLYYVGGQPTGNTLGLNSIIPGDRRTVFVEGSLKF